MKWEREREGGRQGGSRGGREADLGDGSKSSSSLIFITLKPRVE